MILTRIGLASPGPGRDRHITIPLAPGYGATAEVAHQFVLLAVTAAEWPLVVDAAGELHAFEAGSIRSVVTWDSPST